MKVLPSVLAVEHNDIYYLNNYLEYLKQEGLIWV